jgi:hypothetical protein
MCDSASFRSFTLAAAADPDGLCNPGQGQLERHDGGQVTLQAIVCRPGRHPGDPPAASQTPDQRAFLVREQQHRPVAATARADRRVEDPVDVEQAMPKAAMSVQT